MTTGNMTTLFEAGQCLVTPLHGVCEIMERAEQEILGHVQVFYVLQPLDEPGLLKLPQKSLEPGVRPLIDEEGMRDLLTAPMGDTVVPQLRPHQRVEAWLADLKQGCPRVRRRVLWQMGQVRLRERKLSPVEDLMCERVLTSFRREVEIVLDVDGDEARRLVEDATGLTCPL